MKKIIYVFSILFFLFAMFCNIKSFNFENINRTIASSIFINHAFADMNECGDCEGLDCDSGGQGSSACSVGGILGECSVSCQEECYACCDDDRVLCRCC